MEWIPAPTPINENRKSQAEAKTGIIDKDQVKLFEKLELVQQKRQLDKIL
jgi:hypothetical protein